MPFALQRGQCLLGDRFLAAATFRCVQPLVVGGAVRLAVALEERLAGQLLLAGSAADEVLQMPCLAHCLYHLLDLVKMAGGNDTVRKAKENIVRMNLFPDQRTSCAVC